MSIFDSISIYSWMIFFSIISVMLALDLGVFHKKQQAVSVKEGLAWFGVWTTLAFAFAAGIWKYMSPELAQQFASAFIIEKCLSVDNIFVFILIFSYFKVKAEYQHKVLFWGIIGAILMRIVFIMAGVSIINTFHWVLYIFGAFLLFTGIKMVMPSSEESEVNPEKNWAIKFYKKFFSVSTEDDNGKFFTRKNGILMATPLFVVLLVIETTDLVFALDSIPAVLAMTNDGFVALTSNVFAILGLRSLYFALNGVMKLFRYLKIGLSIILSFIGVKMLIQSWYKIETSTSLIVIASILITSVLMSYFIKEKQNN
jgi:tellurite resistance protein TerC